MNEHLKNVEEFHKTFNAPVSKSQGFPSKERELLRLSLILEELCELAESGGELIALEFSNMLNKASNKIQQRIIDEQISTEPNIVGALDALGDIDYVLNGTVLEFGLQEVFDIACKEIHRSNMTKACSTIDEAERTIDYRKTEHNEACYYLENNGKYIVYRKGDHKIMKSIDYESANLKQFIL